MHVYDQILNNHINAERLVYYIEQSKVLENADDVTSKFFKDKITNDDIIKILQTETKINKVIEPSSMDASPTYRERGTYKEDYARLFFFREAMYLTESESVRYLDILKTARTMKDSALLTFIKDYFDDSAQLIRGANLQSERMRASLLSTGGFEVKSKDGLLTYASSFRDEEWEKESYFKLTGADTWTKANAETMDPVRDIATIIESRRDKGVIIRHLVMTRKTLAAVGNCKAIKDMLAPLLGGYVGSKDIKQYIEDRLDITIHLYDKIYKDTDGNDKPMFKDGVITFLPEGVIGHTYYTETPEEKFKQIANMSGAYGDDLSTLSILSPNISLRVGIEPRGSNPFTLYTVVSQLTAPIVKNKREVSILEVGLE